MATYLPLPPLKATAVNAPDINQGNWTNVFRASDMRIQIPYFLLTHAVITSAPAGGTCSISINNQFTYGFSAPGFGGGSEYDPQNPLILLPGQDLFFPWTVAASGTAPVVTVFFKFDYDIPANAAVFDSGGGLG